MKKPSYRSHLKDHYLQHLLLFIGSAVAAVLFMQGLKWLLRP